MPAKEPTSDIERAHILDPDHKIKRLTIISITDRAKFILAYRKLFPDLNLTDIRKIADNLPHVVEEYFSDDDSFIDAAFSNNCKYFYSRIPANYNSAPPWETQKYIDCENWYKSLPEEDREKIDVLVNAAKIKAWC